MRRSAVLAGTVEVVPRHEDRPAPSGRHGDCEELRLGLPGGCASSYRDECIPPPPPDLDCADIARKVRVGPPDPHRLEGDRDGWGCESYS
jgi:hypothetical protein